MVDLAACDANLAASLRTTIGRSRSLDLPGLALGATGYDSDFFNSGVVLDPVPDLAAAVAFFGDLPFSLWCRDGLDPEIDGAVLGAGLSIGAGPPLLVLDEVGDVPAPPDGVGITEVGADDLPDTVTASAIGNGMPPHFAAVFANDDLLADPDVAIVLARVDGTAVATAMTVVSGDAIGIYAVSTVPEWRGKGLGAAVTWAAVAAGRERGGTWSVLQSSAMGLGVYERMGYRVVGDYRFIRRPRH
jgi:GNAT superfamily N-acetyltransferase